MLKLQIGGAKIELKKQLLPWYYDGGLVISTFLNVGEESIDGLFYLKDNSLYFINNDDLNLPEVGDLNIEIPSTMEELDVTYTMVQYYSYRVAMTPDLTVTFQNTSGLVERHVSGLGKQVLKIMADFISNYERNEQYITNIKASNNLNYT